MVPNITTVLQRFTGEWALLLQPEAILAVCQEIGYTGWRDRVLTPVTTMHLFLLQILHGNTACSHLPHLSGLRFSAAAYCQARARLPRRLFDLLLERFSSAVQRSRTHGSTRDARCGAMAVFTTRRTWPWRGLRISPRSFSTAASKAGSEFSGRPRAISWNPRCAIGRAISQRSRLRFVSILRPRR